MGGGDAFASVFKAPHLGGIPRSDGLIEGLGIQEHGAHVLHLGGIPRSDGLIEGLVEHGLIEGLGMGEHHVHLPHLGGIPRSDGASKRETNETRR